MTDNGPYLGGGIPPEMSARSYPQGQYNFPPNYGNGPAPKPAPNPLELAIPGAALLAFIFSFFDFYNYTEKGCQAGVTAETCPDISQGAWHGFLGWFGVLLVVVAAAVSVLVGMMNKGGHLQRVIGMGVAALGVLMLLIALGVTPDLEYQGQTIPSDSPDVDAGVDWSYFIVLIAAVVVIVLMVMRFLQTGGKFATVFSGLGGGSAQGAGYGPGGVPRGYPQQGYQQPQAAYPPAQGYPPNVAYQQPQPQTQQPQAQQPQAGYPPVPQAPAPHAAAPQAPAPQAPAPQGYEQTPPAEQQHQPGYEQQPGPAHQPAPPPSAPQEQADQKGYEATQVVPIQQPPPGHPGPYGQPGQQPPNYGQ